MKRIKLLGIVFLVCVLCTDHSFYANVEAKDISQNENSGIRHQINFDEVNVVLGMNKQIKLTEKKGWNSKSKKNLKKAKNDSNILWKIIIM